MNKRYNSKTIAKIGLMTAISCVLLLLIRIPFPPAPFLKYDPADVPIFVTAFAFGPIPGIVVTGAIKLTLGITMSVSNLECASPPVIIIALTSPFNTGASHPIYLEI